MEFLRMADSQYYLILVPTDLEDERFITSSAVMRQVFERFGDRRRRTGKVEKNANRPHVHLGRDVQSEEVVVGLHRGQFEEPVLGSDGYADIALRQLTSREPSLEQGRLRIDPPSIEVTQGLARGDAAGPQQRALLRDNGHDLIYQFFGLNSQD